LGVPQGRYNFQQKIRYDYYNDEHKVALEAFKSGG